MCNAMIIKNEVGRRFLVKFLAKGDSYGLTGFLTADKNLVEFYDLTYANQGEFGEDGQFVSRYYVSTILGRDDFTKGKCESGRGLQLQGDVEVWGIDGQAMNIVRGWLANMNDRETLKRKI